MVAAILIFVKPLAFGVRSHLWLDHPELGEVATRVTVLGTERGAKRVHL
jgi:hypothetical protein